HQPMANLPVNVHWGLERWDQGDMQFQELGSQQLTLGPEGTGHLDIKPSQIGYLVVKAETTDSRHNAIRADAWCYITDGSGEDFGRSFGDMAVHLDKKKYA